MEHVTRKGQRFFADGDTEVLTVKAFCNSLNVKQKFNSLNELKAAKYLDGLILVQNKEYGGYTFFEDTQKVELKSH